MSGRASASGTKPEDERSLHASEGQGKGVHYTYSNMVPLHTKRPLLSTLHISGSVQNISIQYTIASVLAASVVLVILRRTYRSIVLATVVTPPRLLDQHGRLPHSQEIRPERRVSILDILRGLLGAFQGSPKTNTVFNSSFSPLPS